MIARASLTLPITTRLLSKASVGDSHLIGLLFVSTPKLYDAWRCDTEAKILSLILNGRVKRLYGCTSWAGSSSEQTDKKHAQNSLRLQHNAANQRVMRVRNDASSNSGPNPHIKPANSHSINHKSFPQILWIRVWMKSY